MNLQLSLKREWFDMTGPNGKTEDYREITPYWIKRLMSKRYNIIYLFEKEKIDGILKHIDPNYLLKHHSKKFTTNTITLGYPCKTDRSRFKIYEHAGIEIGFGKPEWGAPTDRMVFIIKHGKQLEK